MIKTLMRQNQALLTWGGILAIIMILTVGAPLFTRYNPLAVDLKNVFSAPNLHNFLGTDNMGRDILARILYGGRISLTVSFLSVLISTIMGIIFGGISGYLGGWADNLMMRLLDAFLAIPTLIIMLALQAVIKGGVLSMILIIGFTGWMTMARIVRSQFQALKEKEFVKAAIVLHTPAWKIAIYHLLRNSLSSIIVMAIFNCAQAVFVEVSLSFLGLGVPPQIPSWGNMLSNAQNDILIGAWWVGVFPGLMIVLSLLCINFLGEALQKKVLFDVVILKERLMAVEIKKQIAGHWDYRASKYDTQYAHGLRSGWEKEAWLRFLHTNIGPPPQKVLDIGTGTGFIALLLAELGYQCKGLDISRGMLAEAQSKAKLQGLKVEFEFGDAEALSEPDRIYDVVVNRHLLWTLPNPERAIAEWLRVLKPGGRLVIIDGNWFYNEFSARARRFAGQLLVAITEGKNPWNHENDYDDELRTKLPLMQAANARKLKQLVNQSGLRDLKVQMLTEVEEAERRVMPFKQKLLNPYQRMALIGVKP